jgi:ElaA protein
LITFRVAAFSDLDVATLYAWMALRQRVFVVEQNAAYQDADGVDRHASHVLAFDGDLLVAGARVIPAGVLYADAAIGRVVCAPEARGTGLGRRLMDEALAHLRARWGDVPVHISAQAYLHDFYASLGFVVDGEGYLEDGIPHWPMTRPASAWHPTSA